ncbi:MAG TPA: epimerase [Clostridiales bacterium]|nr:MAG: epimerase [Clostridiales bacterium GWD2_32_59]HAN10444.1 epimerase [Clostridiales bacterium]
MGYILITGGAGFIGSNLSKKLLMLGEKIIILDNFNDYYDVSIKEKNISEINDILKQNDFANDNLVLYKGDIRDTILLDEIFKKYKIKIIIHLAAMGGVRYSIQEPLLYQDVNICGTIKLLEKCKEYNVKKIISASSSSVYGNNKKVPFNEDDRVDFQISPYGATKKAGELICYTYHHLYDINCICLRFFTVYGPGQRPDLAIHKFIDCILNDKSIPVFGDGSTKRDYTYIDDITEGIAGSMRLAMSGEKIFEIINIGNSSPISLNEMISTIEQVIGKKAKINRLPMQQGDVDITFADIKKAKRLINYNPQTSFYNGVENFIKWYIVNLKKR